MFNDLHHALKIYQWKFSRYYFNLQKVARNGVFSSMNTEESQCIPNIRLRINVIQSHSQCPSCVILESVCSVVSSVVSVTVLVLDLDDLLGVPDWSDCEATTDCLRVSHSQINGA